MFRLQDNVPSTYVDQSRDFQLLCRLYDYANAGVQFDALSITNLTDVLQLNDRMLKLYATKVGFFTNLDIESNLFRHILKVFPTLLKNKGSKQGVEQAIATILKFENTSATFSVEKDSLNHSIAIHTSTTLFNKRVLKEVLKYILPVGYTVIIDTYKPFNVTTHLLSADKVTALKGPTASISQVRVDDRILGGDNAYDFDTDMQNNVVGSYIATEIVDPGYTAKGEYGTDRLSTERDTLDKAEEFRKEQNNQGE